MAENQEACDVLTSHNNSVSIISDLCREAGTEKTTCGVKPGNNLPWFLLNNDNKSETEKLFSVPSHDLF